MTRIIALVNHKGGVGKTTTTLNLGKALSLQGKKVLLIDIDPQANLSQSVGIREPEFSIYQVLCDNMSIQTQEISNNFSILPADLELATAEASLNAKPLAGYVKLRDALNEVKNNYDFILIDCPPSLGILTINGMSAATEIMVIAEPEYLSITGLKTILDLYEQSKKLINPQLEFLGLLFCRFNRTVVNRSIFNNLQNSYADKVFHTVIRQNVKISEASLNCKDIFDYDAESIGAKDYLELANEILKNGKTE